MQQMTPIAPEPQVAVDLEERAAPRYTLLIRTAKLVVDDREYLCLLRDVSATGASIRLFHPMVAGNRYAIEFETGDRAAADMVWQEYPASGFAFHTPINVDALMMGNFQYPKRDLRFAINHPVELQTRDDSYHARIINISRQGGRIVCDKPLSIDQPIKLKDPAIPDIEARVRWKGDHNGEKAYGLVFDTTFSLAQLASLLHDLQTAQVRR